MSRPICDHREHRATGEWVCVQPLNVAAECIKGRHWLMSMRAAIQHGYARAAA